MDYTKDILSQFALKLNEEKTRIINLKDGFIFLGYEFTPQGKRPSQNVLQTFIEKIVDIRPSKKEESKIEQRLKLQSIIQGWLNYFKLDITSHKELIKRIEAILKGDPSSFPAHLALSALYLEFDNTPRAKELINKSVRLSSDNPEIA